MSGWNIQGVVFDVDGVLFDTERLCRDVWTALSQEMGWPQAGERYLEFVGQNRTDMREKMRRFWGPEFPMEEFLLTCSQRSQARIEREGVPLKPGVEDILSFLQGRGIPLALATSTGQERTARRMELTGLGRYFQAIITGDMIEHSKPHPEIYQLACRRLGVQPEHALAVEDSRNGILSAHAAGMPVAMVPDLIPPTPELEELICCRCDSLTALRERLARELA